MAGERFKFKLRLSRALPLSGAMTSLQICRPKDPSASVHTPVPRPGYRLSHVNSKVFDISFPSARNLPSPPPSTPDPDCNFITKRHVSSKKPVPAECGCPSQELSSEWSFRSPDHQYFSWNKKEAARCHADVVLSERTVQKNTSARVSSSRDSGSGSGCFSSEEEARDNESKETGSTTSRSNHYCSTAELDQYPSPPENTTDVGQHGRKKKKKCVNTNIKQIRRHRRRASKESYNGSDMMKEAASVFSQKADGNKVKHSVAVVKKSLDPYEDFKRSMLEMILQKQMFDAKDLEQLLVSFLSLNSTKYHGIIVDAFSDIWQIFFSD